MNEIFLLFNTHSGKYGWKVFQSKGGAKTSFTNTHRLAYKDQTEWVVHMITLDTLELSEA